MAILQEQSTARIQGIGGVTIPRDTTGDSLQAIAGHWQEKFSKGYLKQREQQGLINGAKAQIRRNTDGSFIAPDLPDINTVYGSAYQRAVDINFDTAVRSQYRSDLAQLHLSIEQDQAIPWAEKANAFQEQSIDLRETSIDSMPEHLQPGAIANFGEIVAGHQLKIADDSYNLARSIEFGQTVGGINEDFTELVGYASGSLLLDGESVVEGEIGFTEEELRTRLEENKARLRALSIQYPKQADREQIEGQIASADIVFDRAIATSEYSKIRQKAGREGGTEAGREAGAAYKEKLLKEGAPESTITWLEGLEGRWDREEGRILSRQKTATALAQDSNLERVQLDFLQMELKGFENVESDELIGFVRTLQDMLGEDLLNRSGGISLLSRSIGALNAVSKDNEDLHDEIQRTLLDVDIRNDILKGGQWDIQSLIDKRPDDKQWVTEAGQIIDWQRNVVAANGRKTQAELDAIRAAENIRAGHAPTGKINPNQLDTILDLKFKSLGGDPFKLNNPQGWEAGLAELVSLGNFSNSALAWIEDGITSNDPVRATWAVTAYNVAHQHSFLNRNKDGQTSMLNALSVPLQARIKHLDYRLQNIFGGNLSSREGLKALEADDPDVYNNHVSEWGKQQEQRRKTALDMQSRSSAEVENMITEKLGFDVFGPFDQEKQEAFWRETRSHLKTEDSLWANFTNTDSDSIQTLQRSPDVSEIGTFMGYRISHPLSWLGAQVQQVNPFSQYGPLKWLHLLFPGTQRTESSVGYDIETQQLLRQTLKDVVMEYPNIPKDELLGIASNKMAGLTSVTLLGGRINENGGIDPIRTTHGVEEYYRKMNPGSETVDAFYSAMDVYNRAIHNEEWIDDGISPQSFDENPLSAFTTGRFIVRHSETLSRAKGHPVYEMLIRDQDGELHHWRGHEGNGIVLNKSNNMQTKALAEKLAAKVWKNSVLETGRKVRDLRRHGIEQTMIPMLSNSISLMLRSEALGILSKGYTSLYTDDWRVLSNGPGEDLMGEAEVGNASDYGPTAESTIHNPDPAAIEKQLAFANKTPMGIQIRPTVPYFLDDKLRLEEAKQRKVSDKLIADKALDPGTSAPEPLQGTRVPTLTADMRVIEAIAGVTNRTVSQVAASQRFFEQWRLGVHQAETLFGYKYSDVYSDLKAISDTNIQAVHDDIIKKYGGKQGFTQVMSAYGLNNPADNQPGTVDDLMSFSPTAQADAIQNRKALIQTATDRTVQEETISLLLDHEGFSSIPYPDGNGMSVGHGFRLDYIESDERAKIADMNNITHQEALNVLGMKVEKLTDKFTNELPGFSNLTIQRQSALISMAYQLGYPNLKTEWPKFWSGVSAAVKMDTGVKQEAAFADAAIHMIYNEFDDGSKRRTMWAVQTPGRAYAMFKLIRGMRPVVVQ